MPKDLRNGPIHPGRFIKEHVLPPSLSVKEAAKLLGVGRPALSNLLNGNASLSPEMAMRLEKAFSHSREQLLALQAEYDDYLLREREKNIPVRTYARSAVAIRAIDIQRWAGKIDARAALPAMVRRLVHTTGVNLSRAEFPAYDNSQRKGWDGQVETDTATPWIPSGRSGWEFGCDQNPAQKAERDYEARTGSTTAKERRETTFVFATPHNWEGKKAWAAKKRVAGDWKDVRVIEASDFEAWFEQSLPAQCWMADQLGIVAEEVLSLDECWKRWASVTDPDLNKDLFGDSVESHKKLLADWLAQPPVRPLVVTAASQDEAVACLVCLFEGVGEQDADRAIVIRSVSGLTTANKAIPNFVAIVASPDAERALAGLQKKQHTVIVRNQNAVEGDIDITINLPSDATFRVSLSAMGFDDHTVDRYARESGQSPTILRRRLSQVQAIKFPPWTQDKSMVRQLIPMVMAGAWRADSKADQEILAHLSGMRYPDIERAVAHSLQLDETPLWSVDRYRGAISKTDALYAVSQSVTNDDLDRFFDAAKYVLCQDDPALDLPEDKRWAANLYGQTRNHSEAIREGLCETLVLLAVHGNNLFRERLGMDVEAMSNLAVRELLKPFDPKTWLSQQRDLPRYAEAAPDEFLDILEEDLNSSDPKVHVLLQASDTGLFGGCPRSGLLWALESLAWKPERLVRVASVLARLSERKIEDNWANKPEGSLQAIFRSWMPQTAASIEQRKAALETLCRRYPKIGWSICIEQFDPGSRIGDYSARPQWRNDAAGAGHVVTRGEDLQLRRKALDIALAWPAHDEDTLGDLIQRLQGMSEEDQDKVWNLIVQWNDGEPDDERKGKLRERIRRYAFTRRGRGRKLGKAGKDRARKVYDILKPQHLIDQYKWLFAEQWVEESADELEEEEFDFRKREERIAKLRVDALRDVWNNARVDGIKELCTSGNASGAIGWHLTEGVISGDDTNTFLLDLVCSRNSERIGVQLSNCVAGFLGRLDAPARHNAIVRLIQALQDSEDDRSDEILRLCKCAPFKAETWLHVDALPEALRARYWHEVCPAWGRYEAHELNRAVDELLAVDRPRAAFSTVRHDLQEIETPRIVRLLRAVATKSAEPASDYRLSGYDVSEAFDTLEQRTDVSKDELAQLEFMYIQALESSKHGTPNLERQIAESPQMFVHALALTFKRSDDGTDPAEWIVPEDHKQAAASASYALLEHTKRIPGTREDGTIDVTGLAIWISEARSLCKRYGREEIGDQAIGKILSSAPVGVDGVWPCEEVREVLEEVASKEIAVGMSIGLYNARGAVWRGPGGDQERALADKYRKSSKQIAFEYPYTANLLETIAKSYDHDAGWQDRDAQIRRRTRQ